MDNRYLVIFDGVCNFCNGAVDFIIKRDPAAKFVFTPMQSEPAKQIMQTYSISSGGPATLVLIKQGKAYVWSDAALEIAKDLSGYWSLFRVLKVIPRPFRDWCYRLFARNRYKMFGKASQCRVPTAADKDRFL
ncbi:thiol-disulfide oxidoreductase DCC family protein [Arsukibacterium sp.]|uniref:thiol-disulfide oxidoreductase DCC family protein n=1 Tax=Arsukibacterium sp. TaxID=1977258 RepID=UPI00299DDC39|nr:DCC1-like thiol-disulfide oxidoreductase family protein [Arsukibacterium sp.]MDX1538048.1 DCC1-like thiol-disulfide oxidoreductase family protein [Arsukibacterium sp.]